MRVVKGFRKVVDLAQCGAKVVDLVQCKAKVVVKAVCERADLSRARVFAVGDQAGADAKRFDARRYSWDSVPVCINNIAF